MAPDDEREDPSAPVPPPTLTRIAPESTALRIGPGEEVVFQIEASSPAGLEVTVEFQVDGRTVATGPRFVYAPEEPGTHTVRGVASDGVSSTARQWSVTVEPPPNEAPEASLSLDPRSGTAPLSVRLRLDGDDPDGRIDIYRVAIEGPEPLELVRDAPIDTTLVLAAGTHAFRATVVDDRGATATARDSVRAVASRINVAPTPRLTVSPDSGRAPLDVTVDARGSDSDGSVEQYELDLDGDGTFEYASRFPIQQSARYTAAGEIVIRMRVTDDEGASARDSVRVVVEPEASPPPPPPNQAPSAAIVVTPTSGEAPLQVTVHASASDPDGSIATLALDLDGDGAFDVTEATGDLSVDHVFETAGTYTLRAIATDDDGASGEATATVTVVETANEAPSGSLAATVTSGEAPLTTELRATGTDPDGSIATWEVDPDDGRGWIEVGPSGSLAVTYPFRDVPYAPRLRLTDELGARTVVAGPEVRVHRAVDASRSSISATGNARFEGTDVEPAVWADGEDALRVEIVVRDAEGAPLSGVPVRLRSLRDALFTPTGEPLGASESITLESSTTDGRGRVVAHVTTRISTQVDEVKLNTFTPFAVEVEADVGHGSWKRLGETPALQAPSPVYQQGTLITTERPRAEGICPGDEITIRVTSTLRFDAPGHPGPAVDRYTVLRLGERWIGAVPTEPYADWLTDASGVIEFRYVPRREDDDKGFRAWIDGVRTGAIGLLALLDPEECD